MPTASSVLPALPVPRHPSSRDAMLTGTTRAAVVTSAARSIIFCNGTAATGIYTLSLHDALPISARGPRGGRGAGEDRPVLGRRRAGRGRSAEHTSELQSPVHLVCRLLLLKQTQVQGSLYRLEPERDADRQQRPPRPARTAPPELARRDADRHHQGGGGYQRGQIHHFL